jgi:hypothetical protein
MVKNCDSHLKRLLSAFGERDPATIAPELNLVFAESEEEDNMGTLPCR